MSGPALAIAGLDDDALDRARTSRDPRFDGRFFIGVVSTGIYCRPTCPVRSPKRSNIRYFASAAAAAEAGFRPCLRCRPEAAPGTPAWLGTVGVVRRALQLIDEGALDEASVDALAERVGIGSRHLRRLFVTHVGASPLAVAHTRRLHFAKRLLDDTRLRITDVALAAGFGSVRRFNDVIRQTYGRSPRQLRRTSRAIDSGHDVVLLLPFAEPFDWRQLLQFFAARAIAGVEAVDGESYARTLRTDDGAVFVRIARASRPGALELRVRGATPRALMKIAITARRVFDVDADPLRISCAFAADPIVGPLMRRWPGLRVPGSWDPFECAVRAVLGQQVTLGAGRTFAARLAACCGTRVGDGALARLFPTPAEVACADLDGVGVTRDRTRTLKALAEAVVERRIDFRASAADVLQALQRIPGIGPWTAQYVALRALGDPDAFPAGDLVLRRAAGAGVPVSVAALEALAERWRPWRAYAAQQLWQSATASESSES